MPRTFSRNGPLFVLAAFGGKSKLLLALEKVCFCVALVPQDSKKQSFPANLWSVGIGALGLRKTTWPTKTLRDPFGIWLRAKTGPQLQGPEKHKNMKAYFPETGFHVLPAVPGRRAISNDDLGSE